MIGTLCENPQTRITISHWIFLEWGMFCTNVVDQIETTYYVQYFFFSKVQPLFR
jgi:hypothetical protein